VDQLVEWLIGFLKDRWSSKTALALLVVLATAILVPTFAGIDLSAISTAEWTIVAAIIVALMVIWGVSNRLPRYRRHSVGFGVALTYEDTALQKKLGDDLVARLRELLQDPQLRESFSFVEFRPSVAARVTDRDSARALMKKTRGAFLIHGRVRKRDVQGSPSSVLDLRGLVVHAPIKRELSRQFSEEFAEMLPAKLIVAEENDLFSFELTADYIDLVARYIVGIASAVSGQLDHAEGLFLDVETRLQSRDSDVFPAVTKLRNRIPARIAEVNRIKLLKVYREYVNTREPAILAASEAIALKVLEYEPASYNAHVHRAICAFVLRRDIAEARAEIELCKNNSDGTWRYSEAFLHAYEGDLEKAGGAYRQAFRSTIPDETVPLQSEEFIQIVLDDEPDKVQLYFCLGVINLKAKRDLASARRDLNRFLNEAPCGEWARQVELAEKWIRQIDRQLSGTGFEPVAPVDT